MCIWVASMQLLLHTGAIQSNIYLLRYKAGMRAAADAGNSSSTAATAHLRVARWSMCTGRPSPPRTSRTWPGRRSSPSRLKRRTWLLAAWATLLAAVERAPCRARQGVRDLAPLLLPVSDAVIQSQKTKNETRSESKGAQQGMAHHQSNLSLILDSSGDAAGDCPFTFYKLQ
jgi:hypothetical protein